MINQTKSQFDFRNTEGLQKLDGISYIGCGQQRHFYIMNNKASSSLPSASTLKSFMEIHKELINKQSTLFFLYNPKYNLCIRVRFNNFQSIGVK